MTSETVKRTQIKQMSEAEKLENFKIIYQMNQQINFQKNPRYKTIRPPVPLSSLSQEPQPSKIFSATPSYIKFQEYQSNHIYQIPLTLTNRSQRFQRIRIIPPGNSQFSITDIDYPDKSKGDIAPGMSVKMNVNFNASSLQNFEDIIQIITEEDCLNIQIVASKEPPLLNLNQVFMCPSTFLGDKSQMVFKFTNLGGSAGFKLFAKNQEENSQDCLKTEHFSIWPSEFFIQKKQTMQFQVIFHPQKEGKHEQTFTLACDNLDNKEYILKGVANTVELYIFGLDNQVFGKDDHLQKIFFTNGLMKNTIQKKLIIKNLTQVKVKYHWDIHKNSQFVFNVDDEPKIFWIEPSYGEFPPQSSITFIISFNGQETVKILIQIPYFQKLYMVIEDVPIESIKNVNKGLKDSDRSSLTYLSFDLVGLVSQTEVLVSPEFYKFPEVLSINTTYKQLNINRHTIYIKNQSNAVANYKIQLSYKSNDIISYEIKNNQQVKKFIKGLLKQQEQVEIDIYFKSMIVENNQSLQFWIELDSNEIKSFQIQADFKGPEINIIEPLIDFGIIKPYSINEQEITLENLSSIDCQIICRNADSALNVRQILPDCNQINLYTNKRFRPFEINLAPKEKKKIKIILNVNDTQVFLQYLEFCVKNGNSITLEVFAEVQQVKVSLSRYSLVYSELFLGEKYEIQHNSDQSIFLFNRGIIINLGNIATNYKWQNKNLPHISYHFEPESGIIQPKQKIPFKLQFSALEGPQINHIFVCDIDDLEFPLGIQLQTNVLGLDVQYDLIQSQMIFTPQLNTNNSSLNQKLTQQKPISLDIIDFTASQIKQISTMKFLITNTSGISTKFDINLEKYEPQILKDERQNQMNHRKTLKSLKTTQRSSLTQSEQNSLKNQSYKLEEKLPLSKQLEKNSNLYLQSNKGIAITCEPSLGNLPANKSVEVKVTLYNDICGIFNDLLNINIEGLPQKKFPIQVKVTGSPIMLAPNQVGINLSGEYPTINIGSIVRGTGPIVKNFNLINNGPSEAEIGIILIKEIRLFKLEDDLYEGKDMFNIEFVQPILGSDDLIKIYFNPIEPKFIENDPFISIMPQKTKIKGRSLEQFKVEFFCDQIQKFQYLLVLKPKLIGDKFQNLGIVPIMLQAETIGPFLTLDKKIDLSGNQSLKFELWSYGQSNHDSQTFSLLNDTKTNLIFNIETEGPFKIIESQSNSVLKFDLLGTSGMQNKKIQTSFNLSSASSLQLKVLFESDGEWPMNYRSYKNGLLRIKFNNKDVQTINFHGLLLRPQIKLNMTGYEQDPGIETIDFGTVHVRNQKFLSFYICNQNKVPAKWKLQQIKYPKTKNQGLRTMTNMEKENEEKTEDPSVFNFNISEGVINGPSIPLQKIPIGQVFSTTITDADNKERNILPQEIKPKKSVLYKCKYRILVEEGPYQDFILKGQGTLDEDKEI